MTATEKCAYSGCNRRDTRQVRRAVLGSGERSIPRCAEHRSPVELTEREWQSRVVDYAQLRGWRSYHTFDSRRSAPGFPDLVLVRRGRLVCAELKSDSGRVTQAQGEWLADLCAVVGLEVHLWRPSDWPTVMEVLK